MFLIFCYKSLKSNNRCLLLSATVTSLEGRLGGASLLDGNNIDSCCQVHRLEHLGGGGVNLQSVNQLGSKICLQTNEGWIFLRHSKNRQISKANFDGLSLECLLKPLKGIFILETSPSHAKTSLSAH